MPASAAAAIVASATLLVAILVRRQAHAAETDAQLRLVEPLHRFQPGYQTTRGSSAARW